MKRRITQTLMLALIMVATIGMTFAQKSGSVLPAKFLKLRKHADENAMKVASHDDLPSYQLNYDWNVTNWDTSAQYTYLYNPNGTIATYQYDFYTSNMFIPSSKFTYSYNANGDVTGYLQETWNGIAWESSYRYAVSYDAQGNEAESISEAYSMGTWTIIYGSRYTRQYNGSNEIIEEISEYYNNGTSAWEFGEKSEYQYVSGAWSEIVFSEWDGSAWQIYARITDVVWHNYAKDLASSAKFQGYANGVYTDEMRFTCTFSQFDSEECIWESYSNVWENDSKDIRNNDRLDHEIRSESYSWSGSWVFDYGYQNNYAYDAQDRTLEIVYQDLLTPATAQNSYKEVFSTFFTGAATAIDANVNVTAFPNPVTDQLSFDLQLEKNGPVAIALFDVQGRKRLETKRNYNGNTISIPVDASLENGVYFYQVKMGDAFAKGKVIVQH